MYKRVVIGIEEKLKAVHRVQNSELLRNVAADLVVGVSIQFSIVLNQDQS